MIRFERKYLALVVVSGLGLAACGGASDAAGNRDKQVVADEDSGGDGVVIQDRFAAAAASTVNAGSARMTMRIDMTVPGTGAATMEAEGISDFGTGDSQITMDMGPLLGGLAGDEIGALGEGDMSIEMRVVDGVMYMHFPTFMAQFMGGKPWVSLDASDAMSELGASGPFGQADPKQYLEYLATVSSGVEEIGTETVRDVETTHYKAVIDFSKTLDDVPASVFESLGVDPDEYARQLEQFRAVMGDEMPVEVWIDGDGLLRRMHMDMTVSEGRQSVAMGIEMEMFDYGVDVQVEPPPADQVSDMESMLGGVTGFGAEGSAA